MKKAVPFIIGIGQLQRDLGQILRSMDREEEGIIVSHNQPKAVLMTLKRYEELKALEKAIQKEEEEVLTIVEEGDKEFEAGKTSSAKSLKAFL